METNPKAMLARQMQKLLLCIGILLFSTSSYAHEITVYTEDYKPFQYKDQTGKLTGFGVELVRQIFQGTSIRIHGNRLHLYPWARAYSIVLKEKNTAVFMTVRSQKREGIFKWVGPLAPREMWLYKLKRRKDIQVQTLEDARQYKIGGYNRSADTNYMLELGFDVHVVPVQSLITKMLVMERFDLMSSLALTMADRLGELGLDMAVVEKTVLLDDRYDYYLAINPQTSDTLVKKLQGSLDQIKKNGVYERLWKKYAE